MQKVNILSKASTGTVLTDDSAYWPWRIENISTLVITRCPRRVLLLRTLLGLPFQIRRSELSSYILTEVFHWFITTTASLTLLRRAIIIAIKASLCHQPTETQVQWERALSPKAHNPRNKLNPKILSQPIKPPAHSFIFTAPHWTAFSCHLMLLVLDILTIDPILHQIQTIN